ncbi:Lrp/AsnC family transcriptional regulator [Candidatus Micrarchaeota archaeon]|nr:Lrp/AsnC family transcriptional regulator [Candidatus Micrarchaeota archaeon]
MFLLLVKNHHQLKEFLQNFKSNFGSYIADQQIHTISTVHRFNAKFFHSRSEFKHDFYEDELVDTKIDEADLKLIKILSTDARIPITELSKEIDKSPIIVRERIKKLKEKKILGSHVLALNFDKLGFSFYQLNMSLNNLYKINQIISFFDNTKKCLFAVETIGKYDLAIELHLENTELLRKILAGFKDKFSSNINFCDVFLIYKEYVVKWSANSL